MRRFEFSIVASGLDPQAKDFEDRFFEAGCDDASIAFQKGVIILEFAREADTFSHAILTAFRDVQAAGAKIERVEPDYLVSLSDIAKRAGVTRAAASLYAKGKRGIFFPAPAARVTSDYSLWDWYEVASWLWRQGKIGREEVVQARVVKEANLFLEAKEAPHDNFAERLQAAERDLLEAGE